MINLSFSGCGFLGIYHVGVISAFREHVPDVLKGKISGCSAGALVAACAMCDCCLGQMVSDVLEIGLKARSYALGPLHPSFSMVDILRNGLRRILPVDAHRLCSGRVHISLTRWRDGKNFIVNQFESREDLIQALICSSFVPAYSGLIPPKFRGTYFWDGGLSNNQPVLDPDTIMVSPFGGEADICPRDESGSFFCHDFQGTNLHLSYENIYRISKAFFPPNPEVLKAICFRGYKDAISFLKSRNLLQCSCSRSWEKTSINSMFGEHLAGFDQSSCMVNDDDDEMAVVGSRGDEDDDDRDDDEESDVYDSEEDNLLQYANNQPPLAYQEMPAAICARMCFHGTETAAAAAIADTATAMVGAQSIAAATAAAAAAVQLAAATTSTQQPLNIVNQSSSMSQHSVAAVVSSNAPVAAVPSTTSLAVATTKPSTAANPLHHQYLDPSTAAVMSAAATSASMIAPYYYPKMCARHRLPSVCSSETTGVASGSLTSASASLTTHMAVTNTNTTTNSSWQLQQQQQQQEQMNAGASRRHHRRSHHRHHCESSSQASDMASSVDLNEYRSIKLTSAVSRRRSTRSTLLEARMNNVNSGRGMRPPLPPSTTTTMTTTTAPVAAVTASSASYPNAYFSNTNNFSTSNQTNDSCETSCAIEKIHSNVAIADDIDGKVNHLLNSTPVSASSTPGHKVHFQLNYTTDEDESTKTTVATAAAAEAATNKQATVQTSSNNNNNNDGGELRSRLPTHALSGLTASAPKPIVKQTKNHYQHHNPAATTPAETATTATTPSATTGTGVAASATAAANTSSENAGDMQWESYWDSLEYNCLGRINIDF